MLNFYKKSRTLVSILICFTVTIGFSHSLVSAENIQLNPDGTKPYINYPLDNATKTSLEKKQKAAKEYAYNKYKNINTNLNSLTISPDVYSGCYLNVAQQSQINSYYCGPATASEILKFKNKSITQSTAASYLKTTTNGTDWYNGSVYPMQDTLNHYLGSSYYLPYGTSVDSATFKADVIYDIDANYPVAGDAWEVPNGYHLVGHPLSSTIFHWFAITGYTNYGNSTEYADSVSGASSISWSGNVPQYSILDSSVIATIVNGRGIIW